MDFEKQYCEGKQRKKPNEDCGFIAKFSCMITDCRQSGAYCIDHFGLHMIKYHKEVVKSIISIMPKD